MRAIHATGKVCPCGPHPLDGWLEGLKRLAAMPRSPFIEQVQRDARACWRDGWIDLAAELGWDTLDLFAAHRSGHDRRRDCLGLVCLLRGRPPVRVEPSAAWIAARDGAVDAEPDGFGHIDGCTRHIRRAFQPLDRRDLPPRTDAGAAWPFGTVPVWEIMA